MRENLIKSLTEEITINLYTFTNNVGQSRRMLYKLKTCINNNVSIVIKGQSRETKNIEFYIKTFSTIYTDDATIQFLAKSYKSLRDNQLTISEALLVIENVLQYIQGDMLV